MKRLEIYLGRTVVANALLVLLVLTALASVITFAGEFRSIGAHYSYVDAGLYTLFKIPGSMYDMFTVAVLLGALLGLGELASQNELMVMRVAGLSVPRLGLAALRGGLVLAVGCVLLGEFVIPNTEQQAEDRRASLVYLRHSAFGRGGVWAKDDGNFVNVAAMSDRNTARGVNIFNINAQRQLTSVISAESADFDDGAARLNKVTGTRFGAEGSTVFDVPQQTWNTSLNPELISLFAVDTDSLSAYGLFNYIQYLRTNKLDDHRYVAAFWARVAKPVAVLVMLLLSLPFVFGPLRSSSTGQRLVAGMLVGIGFYVFNSMFMQSGVVFGLNPFFTAWFPTLLLAVVSIVAIQRIR